MTNIEQDKNEAEMHYNLGNRLAAEGDLDGAIAQYRMATRLHPDFADAHNTLGNALDAKGDLDGAITEFRTAIRAEPDHAMAHINLGTALEAKGDSDRFEAMSAFGEQVQWKSPDLASPCHRS